MDRREAPDSIYEALKRLVDTMGGAKVVGHRMRPEMDPMKARDWLLNCLNPEHLQKLDPLQVMLLLRWGHEAGNHDAIAFVCRDAGYTAPAPLAVEDELADLARKAITASHRAAAMQAELQARMRAANINVDALT